MSQPSLGPRGPTRVSLAVSYSLITSLTLFHLAVAAMRDVH